MQKVNSMDYSENWKNLYKKVTENNGYYEMGSVNWYNLASILEDLYVENAELKARVEALEKLYDENIRGMKEIAKIEIEEYTDEQIKEWIEND
jgi:hypothetical protein